MTSTSKPDNAILTLLPLVADIGRDERAILVPEVGAAVARNPQYLCAYTFVTAVRTVGTSMQTAGR